MMSSFENCSVAALLCWASVVSCVAFILSLSVAHLSLFGCLGKVVLL